MIGFKHFQFPNGILIEVREDDDHDDDGDKALSEQRVNPQFEDKSLKSDRSQSQ